MQWGAFRSETPLKTGAVELGFASQTYRRGSHSRDQRALHSVDQLRHRSWGWEKLGVAGYSHDIVAKIYRPLLEKIGKVVLVDDPRSELIPLAEAARRDGLFPLQFSITPFQDAVLPQSLPSVIAPAWEFPDVPDHEFDG